MKQFVRALLLVLAFPALGQAQTVTTVVVSDKLTWDQVGPDATSVGQYKYSYFLDAATVPVPLTTVTCTPAAAPTFTCVATFPPVLPGQHILTMVTANAAGQSPKSSPPFAFLYAVTPAAPSNLRTTR